VSVHRTTYVDELLSALFRHHMLLRFTAWTWLGLVSLVVDSQALSACEASEAAQLPPALYTDTSELYVDGHRTELETWERLRG